MSSNKDNSSTENSKNNECISQSNVELTVLEKKSKNEPKEADKNAVNRPKTGKNNPKTSVSLLELYKYSDCKDRVLQIIGLIFAAGCGLVYPLLTIVFGDMMNAMGITAIDPDNVEEAKSEMRKNSWYFFGLAVINGITGLIWVLCFKLSAERQINRIRYLYFRGIIRQDITWYDENDPKALSNRVIEDTSSMVNGMGMDIGKLVLNTVQFIAAFVVGMIKDWSLTLVIMALGVPLMLFGSSVGMLIGKYIVQSQTISAESSGVVEEAISSVKTVSSFGIENHFINKFENKINESKKVGIKLSSISGLIGGTMSAVTYFTYALGMWYGGKLVYDDQGDVMADIKDLCGSNWPADDSYMNLLTVCNNNVRNMSKELCNDVDVCMKSADCFNGNTCTIGGDVLTVFMAVFTGTMCLSLLGPSLVAVKQACGSACKIFEIIDRIPPIDGMNDKGKKIEHLEGKIEFKNIKFRYPSRPDQVILNGMNLAIEAGKTIGLVGASGCGKSTTIQLLQRFYDSEEGEILIDGMNIRDLNLASLRNQMGFVGQEPVLFNGTVKDNIRNGRLDCTDEDIIKAAKDSNAHNFIMEFPKGYDTYVGEGGHSLSGGQKQRIAIARALVRNPGILLLDEATSALDSESEKIVQAALDELVKQRARTTLIIAHRLSTIESADEIVVFNEGKIAEHGTHSELIAKNGIYAELRNRQMLNKKKEEEEKEQVEEKREVVLSPTNEIRVSKKDSEIEKREKSEIKANTSSSSNRLRLWKLTYPDKYLIIFGIISSGLLGAAMPLFGILYGEIIKIYYNTDLEEMKSNASFWAWMFVIYAVALFIFNVLKSVLFGTIGEELTLRIKKMCFRAMLKQDSSFYDKEENSTGSMTAKLSTDSVYIKAGLGEKVGGDFQIFFTCVSGLIIAFVSYWLLSFVMMAAIPFLVGSIVLQGFIMKKLLVDTKTQLQDATSISSECVNSIKTVQSFGLENHLLKRFKEKLAKPFEAGRKDAYCSGVLQFVYNFVSQGTSALGMSVGGLWALDGKFDFENLMIVIMAMLVVGDSIGNIIGRSSDSLKLEEAGKSVFSLLDKEPAIDVTKNDGDTPEISGEIEFKDVKFRYPTRLDVPVLRKLNLKIEKGEKVALVGSSGCGKSTIISLLERFYNTESGEILLDGNEIKSMNIRHLRKQFGLVSQEPVLFSGTIEENIRMGDYGNESISDEDVVAAAKAANAHNFIMEFPDGYKTEVGNKGGSLSGGQKQRIAIARAILRNPKILLLDEATSALDSESELIVQEAIDKLLESSDRTSIIVAHRLSTIQNADKIFVLDHGVVVEAGKHDELMKMEGGLYHQLATRQML